jgi:xylose isomerase
MKKKIKMKYLSLICYFLAITSLIRGHSLVNSHNTQLQQQQQQKDIDQMLMDELDEFNNVLEYVFYCYYYFDFELIIKKINKKSNKLLELSTSIRMKRSDIDARLLEIQAKILLGKAYQNMPAGHGRFDFKKM